MASVIYDSFLFDSMTGNVDNNTDTFYMMLSTGSFVPNKGTMTKRSDVTNEVTGTGYTSGGKAVTVTVTNDTANHRCDITYAQVDWTASTITGAQVATVYKRRGGASSADELCFSLDNGTGVSTSSGTLSVTQNIIRIQN